MERKGIATGLTWIVAIFIILFFSLVFFASILFLSKNEVLFGKSDNNIEIDGGGSYYLEANLVNFLNEKVSYHNGELTIRELIEQNKIESGDASDVFNDYASKYLEENFPVAQESNWVKPYWVGVFENDGMVIRTRSRYYFISGGYSCMAGLTKENEVRMINLKGKKLVLCINKEFLKEVEGNDN